MTTITDTLQQVFRNKETDLTFCFDGKSSQAKAFIRKTFADIHLDQAPTYTCKIESVVIFDNYSIGTLIQRVQIIPQETWKRLALFVSMVIIAYIFHVSYESYFSLNGIIGTAMMAGGLYKTFQYAKNASYPIAVQAKLSYEDWHKIEHETLANNREKDGLLDPFTFELIPFSEVQSPKYIHLSNWILHTRDCVHGLLEKPELKGHPITPGHELSESERDDLTSQICKAFNLTSDELMSCWKDFTFSTQEKEDFLKEKYLVEGKLTEEAQEVVKQECSQVLKDVQEATRAMLARPIALYMQTNTDLFRQFMLQTTNCAQAATDEAFESHLNTMRGLLSLFNPGRMQIEMDSTLYEIDLMPSSNILLLQILREETRNKFPSAPISSGIAALLPSRLFRESPTPSLEIRIALIDTLIEDYMNLEAPALDPLIRLSAQSRMIFLFSATEFFHDAIKNAETKKRHQKFQELTGIDLTIDRGASDSAEG